MTPRSFTRLCHLWQKRLRLLDWTITFRQLPIGTDLGRVEWESTPTEHSAVVKVAEAIDREAVELSILHELLHIRMDTRREKGINLLAQILRDAYRR